MPVTSSPSIPVLVKETRKRLGLTQLQFAQSLRVSFQSLNRWERGRTKPLPIILKLLEVMFLQPSEKLPLACESIQSD